MDYNTLELYLSQPRLHRFLIASNYSKTKAEKLYQSNLRVAQSFYPILNLFEIFLRNACHNNLTQHFNNPDWIITEKMGFMSDNSLASSNFFLRNEVIKAENKIRRNIKPTASRIIAEQIFSFWTSLFENNHYRLIQGSIIHIFPHKSSNANRKYISLKLNDIRAFRNRVYHNEPICFDGNIIDFSQAENIKKDIYELTSWIEPDLINYITKFDSITQEITAGKSI